MSEKKLPRIGLTCDHEVREVRGVPLGHAVSSAWYYEAIRLAGGLPLLLPNTTPEMVARYVEHLDGLVIAGGDLDIDPIKYGQERHPALGMIIAERTDFELALFAAAEARGLPILGVCGGMQIINVARGGTLIQDLPSLRPTAVTHRQEGDKRRPQHAVSPRPGGRLATIVGGEPLPVNSTHHQAVLALGRGLVAEASADDDLCEALSDPGRRFLLGVQWHPEAMVHEPRQAAIYRALVEASENRTR